MTLEELNQMAAQGAINELELCSLEGGFYVLLARTDEGTKPLLDASGDTVQVRSITHLRELLRFTPPVSCTMVQQVVHDEMCGMRDGPVEPLRVPVGLSEPW
ncbi:DUF6482 family protein [Pseudomonas sp. GOM6]|uniref:DUF6482 family protein n=1 Tax=Pseudomonas sp. GOM6 TaxID=3036944 RepID=UPI00240944DE|nr:DUF6482 family protein [Pseudomonas sp. GOM6]MDG1580110.1 DUF6482 family protein [Pseudomonas sp. GOM6]